MQQGARREDFYLQRKVGLFEVEMNEDFLLGKEVVFFVLNSFSHQIRFCEGLLGGVLLESAPRLQLLLVDHLEGLESLVELRSLTEDVVSDGVSIEGILGFSEELIFRRFSLIEVLQAVNSQQFGVFLLAEHLLFPLFRKLVLRDYQSEFSALWFHLQSGH